jgi:hypothetical protein
VLKSKTSIFILILFLILLALLVLSVSCRKQVVVYEENIDHVEWKKGDVVEFQGDRPFQVTFLFENKPCPADEPLVGGPGQPAHCKLAQSDQIYSYVINPTTRLGGAILASTGTVMVASTGPCNACRKPPTNTGQSKSGGPTMTIDAACIKSQVQLFLSDGTTPADKATTTLGTTVQWSRVSGGTGDFSIAFDNSSACTFSSGEGTYCQANQVSPDQTQFAYRVTWPACNQTPSTGKILVINGPTAPSSAK